MRHKWHLRENCLHFEKLAEQLIGWHIRSVQSEWMREPISTNIENHFGADELGMSSQRRTCLLLECKSPAFLSSTRAMPQQKDVKNVIWAKALLTAAYLTNQGTSSALHHHKTLHHLWKGYAPTHSHAQVFGPICSPLFLKNAPKKLDNKRWAQVVIEYLHRSKAYKWSDTDTEKPIIHDNVWSISQPVDKAFLSYNQRILRRAQMTVIM